MPLNSTRCVNFFSSINTLLCVVGFEGGFRHSNAAWKRGLGYAREDLEKLQFLDLVHPDDYEATETCVEQLNAGEESALFYARMRHADGHYCRFLWQATASPMEFGYNAVGIEMEAVSAESAEDSVFPALPDAVGSTCQEQAEELQQELTACREQVADLKLMLEESRQKQQAAKQRLSLLGEVMELLPQALLVEHADGHLESLNRRADEILEIPLTVEIFEQLWNADNTPSKTPLHFVFHKIGGHRTVLKLAKCGKVLRHWGQEKPLARILALNDFTGQVSAEEQLQGLQQRLQLFTDFDRVMLFDWDLQNNHIYYSLGWEKQLGSWGGKFDGDSTTIKAWQTCIHPSDYNRVISEMQSFLEGTSMVYDNIHRLQGEDGSYYYIRSRAVALRTEDDKAYRVLCLFDDINTLLRSKDALDKITALEK